MTPEAIMTPGGIADQFTRGLSGVAQAFAQRSAIDRQAKQDALMQIRAEQEQARSDAYMAMAQADRQRAAENAARERQRQAVLDNPQAFVTDTAYGGMAAKALADRQFEEQRRAAELARIRAEGLQGAAKGAGMFREAIFGKPQAERQMVEVTLPDGRKTTVPVADALRYYSTVNTNDTRATIADENIKSKENNARIKTLKEELQSARNFALSLTQSRTLARNDEEAKAISDQIEAHNRRAQQLEAELSRLQAGEGGSNMPAPQTAPTVQPAPARPSVDDVLKQLSSMQPR